VRKQIYNNTLVMHKKNSESN